MKKNIYIDLFAGCGGLSLGLFNSGKWKGKFAVEKSEDAFKTLKHNLINQKAHFDWPNWLPQKECDINAIIKDHSSQLKTLRGEIDLVAGGPPCQGFSTAGRRVENDTRNGLINSYIRFIRLVQPKLIFFENVRGFTQKFDKNKIRGRVYSEYVKKELRKTSKVNDFQGYKVHGELVDFSEFGIPQKRTRFILVGIRKDLNSDYIPHDFFKILLNSKLSFLAEKGLSGKVSLEDAISDLLKTSLVESPDSPSFKTSKYSVEKSNFQKLLRGGLNKIVLPDSHRFANHKISTVKKFEYILLNSDKNKSLSNKTKLKFNLKKRTIIPTSPSIPAPTITTLPDDYIHYCEPRIFTVREYARIQSFNDWYQFKGKYTTGGQRRVHEVPRYSQIGNAIPPLFAEQVGLVLSKLI